MGGSQSTEHDAEKVPLTESRKKSKKYITPDVRAKSRFLIPDTADVTNTFETSIDKYDILLVFNISEGRLTIRKTSLKICIHSYSLITLFS